MAFGDWKREDLEEFVDYLQAKGHGVGSVIHLGGVRGPDPRDPPLDLDLRVEAIRPGHVILNGMAHESGDFLWIDLQAEGYRVPLLKIVAVGRGAVVLAPMRQLVWERGRRSPLGD
jgi:hypothetical protein